MNAPQVTPAMVEANIASEHYFTALDGVIGASRLGTGLNKVESAKDVASASRSLGHMGLLTFCVLVTRNGHTVTGESYCADPAKFSAETGRIEARKVAIEKLWPMMVYELRSKLATQP